MADQRSSQQSSRPGPYNPNRTPQLPRDPLNVPPSVPEVSSSEDLFQRTSTIPDSRPPHSPPPTLPPLSSLHSQVLGRRRRASQDERDAPSLDSGALEPVVVTDTNGHITATPAPKRRRVGNNMFADEERHAPANGTPRPYANGKAQQRPQAGASSNGTHKPAGALNGSSKARPPEKYLGHDREEVTRILIQTLSDMGYTSAAESVCLESGFDLESPTVAAFRSAIVEGNWAEAEQLLSGATVSGERGYQDGNGLVLTSSADRNVMRFWIRQQKFLELLEKKETSQALGVLRTELTPLNQDAQKLPFLSSLLMCQTSDDLYAKADWDGTYGASRRILLSELSSK